MTDAEHMEQAGFAEIERARLHDAHRAGAEAMRLRVHNVLAIFSRHLGNDDHMAGKLCIELLRQLHGTIDPILVELAARDADKGNGHV